jgi:hypothetical protein
MSKEQRVILRIALEGVDVSDDSGAGESLHSLKKWGQSPYQPDLREFRD